MDGPRLHSALGGLFQPQRLWDSDPEHERSTRDNLGLLLDVSARAEECVPVSTAALERV